MDKHKVRTIITIDEEKCTGCGLCVPGCPEGALQVIDGKARLVSEPLCDGLGACLGHCPEGAITVEERVAAPYDQKKVMENIVAQGANVLRAHLEHLRDHGQHEYLAQALEFLRERNLSVPPGFTKQPDNDAKGFGGCPGARAVDFAGGPTGPKAGGPPSALRNWPVQLHLIRPAAPQFRNTDLLLAADCVAYAAGDFHAAYLAGKALAIACPKLDQRQDLYLEKLKVFIDGAGINSLTVLTMEVPCCRGLLALAEQAVRQADRKVPLRSLVVGVRGEIKFRE
jgi:NAD-dependent dihydropyrimidine dehydrogenase PreA subunit